MSGKKNKKPKTTTLSLQEFNQRLDDNKASAGQNVVYAPKKMTSWAEEVEDDDNYYFEKEKIYLPSGPRASRGPAYDDAEIPKEPPYTAHLGNLSYDIGEEDVIKFFRGSEIKDLRLPRDGNSNRLRGFGYVEFETRQDLIEALTHHEEMLKGRQVRINLGTNQNRNDGDRRNDRSGGDRGYRVDETPNDWRSTMVKSRDDFDTGFSQPQTFNRRDGPRDDRRGYQDRPPRPERDGGGRRDGGFERNYRAGSFEEEGPDDWRSSMRPRGEMRERERPQYSSQSPSFERHPSEERRGPPRESEPSQPPEPPRERKKLVLQPRTVPVPVGATVTDGGNSAIFGGAKPVDTAAREREVEEKLAQLSVASSSPPPREPTRERLNSENDRDTDRSNEEPPQHYRILKRPSAERTTGDADNIQSRATVAPSELDIKPPITIQRRSQPSPRIQPPPQQGLEIKPPPKIIQSSRAERERLISSSSLSSRGSVGESPQSHYTHVHQYNGQQRPITNHSSGGPSSHFPVPPAPGASSFHRRKSDSDDGEDDSRSSRHDERQRDAPAPPPTNAWGNRRHADQDSYHSRQESLGPDRKTPDSDRNGEKEKDSHSEPEDDRDSHRYIVEKEFNKDDGFRGVGRDRDYRGGGVPRDRDRDRDDFRRGGSSWNNSGPRRGEGTGLRRGFNDDRRGGRDDRDRDIRRDQDRDIRRDPDRDIRRDQDRDLDRRDLRDTNRRPSGGDRDRERDFRTGNGRMERGRGGDNFQDRGSRGGQSMNRRGGPPMDRDKGMRGPGRMNSRDNDYYRDSDGFENIRGGGRDRPLPKHVDDKPTIVAASNKFSPLFTGEASD